VTRSRYQAQKLPETDGLDVSMYSLSLNLNAFGIRATLFLMSNRTKKNERVRAARSVDVIVDAAGVLHNPAAPVIVS
jgi:hypothetical protein